VNHFPSQIQNRSECSQTPTAPHENVKKPRLVTRNVEKVSVIVQLVDLLRSIDRCVWAVALKSVEIWERKKEAGNADGS